MNQRLPQHIDPQDLDDPDLGPSLLQIGLSALLATETATWTRSELESAGEVERAA